jgi:hypothetical protein
MKKLLLIGIILALGSAATLSAQTYSITMSIATPDHGIIRQNNIAYVEESVGSGWFVYFSSLTPGTPSSRVKVPEGWSIKDFHIIDTTAYFCGTNTNSHTALLGHFGIPNLVSGTGNITFHYNMNILGLAVLNRMAVNGDKKAENIIAIGLEDIYDDPDTKGADHVLYVENYHGLGSCRLFFKEDKDELYWDVVKTDKFFVVAGTDKPLANTLILRRVPVGTPATYFLTDFIVRHWYQCPDSLSSGICMSALNNDSVMMALYYQTPPRTALRLFTLSATTGQMDYNQYIGAMASGVLSLAPPPDMAYLKNRKELMLIDSILYGQSQFYRLDPYPTSWMYTPQYYYYFNPYPLSGNLHYSSLHPVPPNGFMASEREGWLMLDLSTLPAPNYSNGCFYSYTTDMFTDTTYTKHTDTKGKDVPHQIIFGSVINKTLPHELRIGCP